MPSEVQLEPLIPLKQELGLKLLMLLEVKLEVPVLWYLQLELLMQMPFVAPWIWTLGEVRLELHLLLVMAFVAPKIVMPLETKVEPPIPL